MGLFSKPRCPQCGGTLRLVARPLVDAWRCDRCCDAYEEKKKQQKAMHDQQAEMDRMRQEIAELRRHTKYKPKDEKDADKK